MAKNSAVSAFSAHAAVNASKSSSIFRRRSINGDEVLPIAAVGYATNDRIQDRERCSLILTHLGISTDRFAVGKSLLFLKAGVIALLEDESARQRYYYATLITKNVSRYIVRARYKAIRRALLLLQCSFRCSRARITLHLRRQAVAQLLQKNIRRCLHRVAYVRNHASRTLNANIRRCLHRVTYIRNHASRTLNAACRRARSLRSYSSQLNQIYHKAKVCSAPFVSKRFQNFFPLIAF
jgi:myosin heavy subunit